MGQFLDHEITSTISDMTKDPIVVPLPAGETIFSQPITMKRNLVSIDADNCPLQFSQTTPHIDGTAIYGVTQDEMLYMRELKGGRMRVQSNNLLPLEKGGWVAGDGRASEWAGLSIMHTLFVLEHNHWAGVISQFYPAWSDEDIFLKARQFVIAELQVIAYKEWLPALLGSQTYLLGSAVHNPSVDGRIAQEFSVVAYRMGHSMIPNQLGDVLLRDLFGNTAYLMENGVEPLLRGMITTPAQAADIKVVDGLRNVLFGTIGHDLVALNLLRARALAIKDYGSLYTCIHGEEISDTRDPLQGVLSEPLVQGSSVGKTVGVVIADQFKRIRDSDPDFYLWNKASIGTLFYDVVAGVTMKQIIVRNTDLSPSEVSKNAFFTP
jgi:hypothetical protein